MTEILINDGYEFSMVCDGQALKYLRPFKCPDCGCEMELTIWDTARGPRFMIKEKERKQDETG